MISPVLFTIYTNICQINNDNVKLITFADDSCIEGDELAYKESVNYFTSWCDENKLLLNADKTKE